MSQTGYKGTRTDASQFGQIAVALGHRNWRMARGSGRRQEEGRPPWPCPLDVQVALRLATGGRVRVVLAMGREALFCVGARPSPAPHWAWATQYRGSGPTQASSVRDARTMAVGDAIPRIGPHAGVKCPRFADNGRARLNRADRDPRRRQVSATRGQWPLPDAHTRLPRHRACRKYTQDCPWELSASGRHLRRLPRDPNITRIADVVCGCAPRLPMQT